MGTISNGILGGFKGKVGPVSGYTRYGVSLVRTAKNDVVTKNTPNRQAQREKITVCNAFSKCFKGTGFFSKTFPAYGHTGSGYNRAMGSLMNLSLVKSGNGVMISYPLVLISRGQLPPPMNSMASAGAAGKIHFTWTNNSETGTARKNDKAILLAYFPATKQINFSFEEGIRESGTAILPVPIEYGNVAETWMGFLSDDEKDASCSVHTGTIIF